jgi:hypothetical protein
MAATPPVKVTVFRFAAPFLNVTVPVGVLGPAELTFAVSMTDWP